MKSVYEVFFFLKYYGGWSFFEAYNLPVGLRKWFAERLGEQLKKESDAMDPKGKNKRNHSMPSMPNKSSFK